MQERTASSTRRRLRAAQLRSLVVGALLRPSQRAPHRPAAARSHAACRAARHGTGDWRSPKARDRGWGCWNTMPSPASAGTGSRDMSWAITSMRPESAVNSRRAAGTGWTCRPVGPGGR